MTWLLADRPLRSVLVTRLRYLGDVAMSTVLLEVLRAGDPDLELGYLCEQGHGAALAGHPELARLHLLSDPRRSADAKARGATLGPGLGVWGMARELRQARYDLAVDLFFNPRSAWLLWLSGIKARIGGTPKSRRHLYTHTVLAAEVQQIWPRFAAVAPGGLGDHLARLAPLTHAESGQDFPGWVIDNFAPGQLKPSLGKRQDPTVPYLVLAPGATWPSKEWPVAHWRELVAHLAGGSGPRVRVLVPPGREGMWGDLGNGLDQKRAVVEPPLNLSAVRELLAGATALVTVDGGVMHMGVALGVPTVALFGPTDPGIWFPYEDMGPYRVLASRPTCHPCNLHECANFICLPDLAVDQVAGTLARLLGREDQDVPRSNHD